MVKYLCPVLAAIYHALTSHVSAGSGGFLERILNLTLNIVIGILLSNSH